MLWMASNFKGTLELVLPRIHGLYCYSKCELASLLLLMRQEAPVEAECSEDQLLINAHTLLIFPQRCSLFSL